MHGDDHVHAWTRSEISAWQSPRCERKRKDEAYKEKELGDSSNKLDYSINGDSNHNSCCCCCCSHNSNFDVPISNCEEHNQYFHPLKKHTEVEKCQRQGERKKKKKKIPSATHIPGLTLPFSLSSTFHFHLYVSVYLLSPNAEKESRRPAAKYRLHMRCCRGVV
ncbi:hypothetical protein B296_00023652 [Ensete ventricosum]|uniref:Uncharacterized protein n=1 Tax=Ensete ventricosum TaxID=4639 RepID=A0A426XSZ2_ENSVE|nr:hypothetical protein B296_00023652 [Ensete ventricosum]